MHFLKKIANFDAVISLSSVFTLLAYLYARLAHEWQAFVSRTHKLRKTFVSVKGIYYQVLTVAFAVFII